MTWSNPSSWEAQYIINRDNLNSTDCEAAIIIEHYLDSTTLQTFLGAENYMRNQGIQVDVLQDAECIQMMTTFINANPQLWNEDIGV